MAKKVLIPIANGTEEIEAVCLIDILRRAEAFVTVASVESSLQITASRGVRIIADALIETCVNDHFDLIALPGGMPGAERLRDSAPLTELLKKQHQQQGWYAAICAAPQVVLEHHGLINDRTVTGHPRYLPMTGKTSIERVVVDDKCVTSRGAGTALQFALKLVELLYDTKKAQAIAESIVLV